MEETRQFDFLNFASSRDLLERKTLFSFQSGTEARDLLKMNLIVMGHHGSTYSRKRTTGFTLLAELGGIGTVLFRFSIVLYLFLCKPFNMLGAGRAIFEYQKEEGATSKEENKRHAEIESRLDAMFYIRYWWAYWVEYYFHMLFFANNHESPGTGKKETSSKEPEQSFWAYFNHYNELQQRFHFSLSMRNLAQINVRTYEHVELEEETQDQTYQHDKTVDEGGSSAINEQPRPDIKA